LEKTSPLFIFHFKYKWTYIDKYYLIKNLVLIPFLFFNSCVTNSCNLNTKSFQFLSFRWFSHFPHFCVFFIPTFFPIPMFFIPAFQTGAYLLVQCHFGCKIRKGYGSCHQRKVKTGKFAAYSLKTDKNCNNDLTLTILFTETYFFLSQTQHFLYLGKKIGVNGRRAHTISETTSTRNKGAASPVFRTFRC
jgi:hypothetical protein